MWLMFGVGGRTSVSGARFVELGGGHAFGGGDGEANSGGRVRSKQSSWEHPGETCTVVSSESTTTWDATRRLSR